MSIDVWGLLPRSQDDPTTIDQAIAEALATHNDDNTSHLGTSQSLENHRADSVLDHPAGSTLADKWTMSEIDISTSFESLVGFSLAGTVFQTFPGVQMYPSGTGNSGRAGVYFDLDTQNILFDNSKDSLLQFAFVNDTFAGGKTIARFGWSGGVMSYNGMGLEIDDGVARFFVGNQAGSSVNYLDWNDYSDGTLYVVRAQNTPAEGVVKFYVNGILLGTLEWPDAPTSDPAIVSFEQINQTGGGNILNLLNVFLSFLP